MEYIEHHGIKGQKWGIRRFQNEDGSLTEAGKKRLERKDNRWAKRNQNRITNSVYRKSKREITKYQRKVLDKEFSVNGKRYMNAYNQKLAEIMSSNATKYSSPSGKVVRFVAKRGDYGVYMALATQNYDMSKVRQGVYTDGRVAYKKTQLNRM